MQRQHVEAKILVEKAKTYDKAIKKWPIAATQQESKNDGNVLKKLDSHI